MEMLCFLRFIRRIMRMKRLFVTVFLSVVFVTAFLAGVSHAKRYFPLTPSQKHFTAIVKQLPGVTKTEWKTPISLWVTVSSKALGSPPSKKKASTLASILADRGKTALYQPFCVHIYHKHKGELGSECVY